MTLGGRGSRTMTFNKECIIIELADRVMSVET